MVELNPVLTALVIDKKLYNSRESELDDTG